MLTSPIYIPQNDLWSEFKLEEIQILVDITP